MLSSRHGQFAAIRIVDGDVHHITVDFTGGGDGRTFSDFSLYALRDLDLTGLRQNLKKRDPLYVLPVTNDNCRMLESELLTRYYKGVTDLVTKWLWPVPAFWTVRFCVRFGLRLNHVTLLSLVLVRVAFWHSHHGAGLVMGWLMTFLDTADGKLARVTVTSSRFGDVLDHGVDHSPAALVYCPGFRVGHSVNTSIYPDGIVLVDTYRLYWRPLV